ncbi:MAG: hypothetical protein AAFZ49_10830, partial [Cyanobacteria bacterium J06659_2]
MPSRVIYRRCTSLLDATKEITNTYPSLTLEQVYATILYYLYYKEVVDAYMTDWLEWAERMREEQRLNPSPVAAKLRRVRA